MIHTTEIGSDSKLSLRVSGRGLVFRTLQRSRAMVRLSRRRPQIALGLVLAAGSTVAAAVATGNVITHQVERYAHVEPLAPAPPVPHAPEVAVTRKHRLFRTNPLRGLASWYGEMWHGRPTASGETFDETKLTAAHKTLPLGTVVRVIDMDNMKSVVVKINDRGTLAPNRIIDLSSAAARELGILEQGLAHVKLEIVKKGS